MTQQEYTPEFQHGYVRGYDSGHDSGMMEGIPKGYELCLDDLAQALRRLDRRALEEWDAKLGRHAARVAHDAAVTPTFEELCIRRGDFARAQGAAEEWRRIQSSPSPWRQRFGGAR
ncbi:hypothetical protein [Actinomyces culturomici]|uniref:hypothetical protein n=1 Tax=Actinomyces culturomici TaxID=1926276 RepID=UPI000E208F70|nr:hypothetical protein [Actinomyces culturomici]